MMIKAAISALLLAAALIQAFELLNFNDQWPGEVEVGVPYILKWSGNQGPVTIKLFDGGSFVIGDTPILVLVEGFQGTEYTWTPPTTLAANTSYAVHLNDAMSTIDYAIIVAARAEVSGP
jgi:hypothetical protein